MILNYLKVFMRLFFRHTAFTLINILGLAVGLACCLVIALFVRHEFSFDRLFTNADMLYRVGTVAMTSGGAGGDNAPTFFPVAPLLAANFLSITEIARMQRSNPTLLSIGEEDFYENGFRLVDPAFFHVFGFTWLEGDAASALAGATDVVLTRSFAEKHFGSESPLGQTLVLSEGAVLRVTGVIEDLPGNTHLSGSVFAAMALRDLLEPPETRAGEWVGLNNYTYVVLPPDVDIEQLRRELELVACANFVNLSTARSAQRFSEMGLRLTLGARRGQLIGQFLGESVLFVLLAIVLALTMIELLLPGIQTFLELDLAFDSLMDPRSLGVLLVLGLLLGVAAGWYPALLMSRFKPALALKREQASLLRGIALKNVLVVLQFAIAIGMIIGSIVIWSQLRFAGALELGYASDQVVVVTTNELGSRERIGLLKERLLQGSDIVAAAMSDSTPEMVGGSGLSGNTESDATEVILKNFSVDFDYLSLYRIPLLTGRLQREDLSSDLMRTVGERDGGQQREASVVLNESGARRYGWSPEEALGKRITDVLGSSFTVIGVVGDTIQSAHVPAIPSVYTVPEGASVAPFLSLKLGGDPAVALAFIDRTWNEINPEEPIVRSFLDDNIDARYRSDSRLMQLAFVFGAIAIVISCMGLFGLANFNAEKRFKEIGVRKVMGSSVWGIVCLLTSDFSKLVLLAYVLAWPVAYFAMTRWLENFAYRIDLTPLVFIGSGLIALCIAWVTVGGTAAKAANQKPVLALRYE